MARARKRFGQHFLIDNGVIARIADFIKPQASEHFVEIGPGRGALTTVLLEARCKLTAIEIDRELAAGLRTEFAHVAELNVRAEDVLNVDFHALEPRGTLRVVGNLPYNISTPIILQLMRYLSAIDDVTIMLQQEVAERLAAPPGSKTYGRLSVVVQSQCRVETHFSIPPDAFDPPPKVTSMLVTLLPNTEDLPAACQDALAECVRIAFGQRRKSLRNTLGKSPWREQLISNGIDLNLRPEQVAVDDYVKLARAMAVS